MARKSFVSFAMLAVITTTISPSASALENEVPVGGGFDIATFLDRNSDGVTDADNPAINNAPFLPIGANDGF